MHTADWQIGKVFGGFDHDTAGLLKEARLGAIDCIGDAAVAAGARHVLVAGDVYDVSVPETRTLRQPLERMRRYEAVTWHLLPGNHDHLRDGGIWDRLTAIGLPDNVIAHLEASPSEIQSGIWLLPAPLKGRATSLDPTAWMDSAVTPDGAVRIGLAHGSVRDFGTAGETSVRIDPRRVKLAGLAYLALGDWHGVLKISDRCWYCGTPEPDRWPDNDPGHALAVQVDGHDQAVEVTVLETATYRWLKRSQRIEAAGDLNALSKELAGLELENSRLMLHLTLTGSVSLRERAAVDAKLEEFSGRYRHLSCDQAALHSQPDSEDHEQLAAMEGIGTVAARLGEIAAQEQGAQGQIAERALLRLYGLAVAGGKDAER